MKWCRLLQLPIQPAKHKSKTHFDNIFQDPFFHFHLPFTDFEMEILPFEGPLHFDRLEELSLESLSTIHVESEFAKREKELSLKAKIAQERYQDLFKELKIIGSTYGKTIELLTKKNNELQVQVKKLKGVDDGSTSSYDYDYELDVLRTKNVELEETVKKNLATISELRKENSKLEDEKRGVEKLLKSVDTKFRGLHERVARLEDDTERLMSVDDSEGESDVDPMVAASGDKDEEDVDDCEFRNGAVEGLSSSLQGKSIKQKRGKGSLVKQAGGEIMLKKRKDC